METKSKITYGLTKAELEQKPSTTFHFNNKEYHLLDKETETSIDVLISELDAFLLDENNWNKEASTEAKNIIFTTTKEMITNFKSFMSSSHYNLFLNRREINWFEEYIIKHCLYDNGDEIFNGMLIKNFMIEGEWRKNPKPKNDTDLYLIELRGSYLSVLFHFLKKYTVKGLTKDAELFTNFVNKLEMIANINNFYSQKALAIDQRSLHLNSYNTTDEELRLINEQSQLNVADTSQKTEVAKTEKTVRKGKATTSAISE